MQLEDSFQPVPSSAADSITEPSLWAEAGPLKIMQLGKMFSGPCDHIRAETNGKF